MKLLGITIDQKLKFDNHVYNFSKNAASYKYIGLEVNLIKRKVNKL